jgi:hypothetical protein
MEKNRQCDDFLPITQKMTLNLQQIRDTAPKKKEKLKKEKNRKR